MKFAQHTSPRNDSEDWVQTDEILSSPETISPNSNYHFRKALSTVHTSYKLDI